MDSSAEAGQPKQNKNSPDADDPTLDSKWDCELPMLFSITLPIPKKVTRPSGLRGNLLLRFLDDYGWGDCQRVLITGAARQKRSTVR